MDTIRFERVELYSIVWKDALSVVAPGERAMDPGALLAYFAPLKRWLDAQNEGHRCGW